LSARKLFQSLAQIILIILITCVLLEIPLRLFPRLIPPFLLADFNPAARARAAEQLGYPTEKTVRLLPRDDGGPPRRMRLFRPGARVTLDVADAGFVNTVSMDEEGFCNPADAAGRASLPVEPGASDGSGGRPRVAGRDEGLGVVALGDSFTWCTGVRPEQAWPAQLERLLGERTANLGSPGIGLYEHLQILREYGVRQAPRVVVLSLYEGNDLRDAEHFHAYRRQVGTGAPAATRRLIKDRPLARNSYAYNLIVVGARAMHHAARRRLARWAGIPTGEEPEVEFRYTLRFPEGEVPFNGGNLDQDEVRSARALRSGRIEVALFREGLVRFMELSRRHGFLPVVAYTPSAHTAYAPVVAFQDESLEELMPWFSARQREYLASAGGELGFTFVDLTPAFQEAAREKAGRELLYFPTVLHLTPRGHAVVAEALARALRSASGNDTMPPEMHDPAPSPAATEDHR
jgi:lysophospholipase L1-like esterase